MKKIALAFIVGAMSGCGPDPEPSFKYSYSIFNDAGFEIRLTCEGCEPFTIADNQTKTLKTNTPFGNYIPKATITNVRKIESEETSIHNFTLWSYEYDVIYTVAGDSPGADVILKDAAGETVEYLNQGPLPVRYYFRDFPGHEVYLSAKNKYNSGVVRVLIFHKEKLLLEKYSATAYGTATASGSI